MAKIHTVAVDPDPATAGQEITVTILATVDGVGEAIIRVEMEDPNGPSASWARTLTVNEAE